MAIGGAFAHAASVRFDLVPFPLPAHRTGQADFPHPALGKDAHRTESRHVTPSATSEHNRGVARLIVNPRVRCCFLRLSLTEIPSLHRTYPVHRYYEPLRHPIRPNLSLASCRLIRTAITAGASRVAPGQLCLHAVAITPAGLMELVRSYCPINGGPPTLHGGRAPALIVSRPAQRCWDQPARRIRGQ